MNMSIGQNTPVPHTINPAVQVVGHIITHIRGTKFIPYSGLLLFPLCRFIVSFIPCKINPPGWFCSGIRNQRELPSPPAEIRFLVSREYSVVTKHIGKFVAYEYKSSPSQKLRVLEKCPGFDAYPASQIFLRWPPWCRE